MFRSPGRLIDFIANPGALTKKERRFLRTASRHWSAGGSGLKHSVSQRLRSDHDFPCCHQQRQLLRRSTVQRSWPAFPQNLHFARLDLLLVRALPGCAGLGVNGEVV
jgi:hypothetical protein